MKLKFDTSVPYALALEGGGARGGYQIGAWRALREAGVQIHAVSGTSVGALNGALIAMGNLERAEEIWREIRYSQVIDVDDETMYGLLHGDLAGLNLRTAYTQLRDVLRNRGLDVAPLYEMMQRVVDEKAVRESDTELFIVTYSLSDRRELELRARDLPEGTICDMLLASAYLPVFRSEPLGGKRYTDGGVRDVLPLHVLVEAGCRDIIAVRLNGFGVERRVRVPKHTNLYTVSPSQDLGGTLDFDPETSSRNLAMGYYDTQRLLYGLRGRRWYFDMDWTEGDAFAKLKGWIRRSLILRRQQLPLREIHERVIPELAKELDVENGTYAEIYAAGLESLCEQAALERWHIYTEPELTAALDAALGAGAPLPALDKVLTPKRRLPVRK